MNLIMMKDKLISLNIAALTPLCGVYFLYDDEELVYIGHSTRIPMRVCEHLSNLNGCEKEFTDAYFLPCEKDLLFATEMACIRRYRPKYNQWRTNDGRGMRIIKPPTPEEEILIKNLLNE